jgi:5-methylcytosine-specific restriction endonuclease McrA
MPTNAELRHIATEQGLTRFDPVGPCIHGHTAQRWVCSGSCVACSKIRWTYGPFPRRKTDAERTAEIMEEAERRSQRITEREGHVLVSMKVYANARRARKKNAAVGCRKAYAVYVKWAKTELSIPCQWCGVETKIGRGRHIDHVIPLARGGADAVENLCIACADCNVRKSSKLPEKFMQEKQLAVSGTPPISAL